MEAVPTESENEPISDETVRKNAALGTASEAGAGALTEGGSLPLASGWSVAAICCRSMAPVAARRGDRASAMRYEPASMSSTVLGASETRPLSQPWSLAGSTTS